MQISVQLLFTAILMVGQGGPIIVSDHIDVDRIFGRMWSHAGKIPIAPGKEASMSMSELHAWIKSHNAGPDDVAAEMAIRNDVAKLELDAVDPIFVQSTCRGGVCEVLIVDRRPPSAASTNSESNKIDAVLKMALANCQTPDFPMTMVGVNHKYRSLYSHFCISQLVKEKM